MARKRKLVTKAEWKNGTVWYKLPLVAIMAFFVLIWKVCVLMCEFVWKWVLVPIYTILKEDVIIPLINKHKESKSQE
ncbi:MAG: hypothetical protein MJZ79_06280 [Paludibacteraceae bacterium]|nr:hypothetical protein [Paludibacteraceae bacterium]